MTPEAAQLGLTVARSSWATTARSEPSECHQYRRRAEPEPSEKREHATFSENLHFANSGVSKILHFGGISQPGARILTCSWGLESSTPNFGTVRSDMTPQGLTRSSVELTPPSPRSPSRVTARASVQVDRRNDPRRGSSGHPIPPPGALDRCAGVTGAVGTARNTRHPLWCGVLPLRP